MPSRALLTESQTIPATDITQALANIGIARVSLSAPVTRTSTTTRTNNGLSALNVNLLPSSRYRVTYRIYSEGIKGIKVALSFPSSLARMDGEIRSYDLITFKDLAIYPDWPNNLAPSEDVIYDSLAGNPSAETAIGSVVVILDIATGSTVNTYGTISLLIAQSVSNALTSTISQNTCVEVLKF
jgi:hypothetical protein